MSIEDFKPGTVAVATVRGVPNVRVFRRFASWVTGEWVGSSLTHLHGTHVTDVRPLVVLDPKGNPEGLDEFRAAWFRDYAQRLRDGESGPISAQMLDFIADQIEAQTKPPKPAEPRGLGAVVEDAEEVDWHRTRDGRWIAADGLRTKAGGWGHIDAVRVLSEGVTNGD